MTIQTVRRLAADIMNVGRNKIRINPDGTKEAEGALTRADVRGLIDKGIITKVRAPGRASTRRRSRTGHGRRRGTPVDSKDAWMMKIRAQRRFLRVLLEKGALAAGEKRSIYGKMKSGIFRNKKAMLLYLKENGLVAADFEIPKAEFVRKEAKPKRAAKGKEKSKAQPAQPEAAKAKPHAHEAKAESAKAEHRGHAHAQGDSRQKEKGEQR